MNQRVTPAESDPTNVPVPHTASELGAPLDRLLRAALIACITATVVFWAAFLFKNQSSRSYQAIRATVQYAILLNGVSFSHLRSYVQTIDSSGAVGDGALRQKLYLVASDRCPATAKLLPRWTSFLESLPPGRVHVVVVSDGDMVAGSLREVLKRRQIPYELLQVTSKDGLSATTGISSTPYTIAIDAESRVRLVDRTLAPEAIARFHTLIDATGGLKE